MTYDALLVISFGGPEGPDEVIPFMENVLRGRNVPRERLEEVSEHYFMFGGVSPLNQQNRDLIAALEKDFAAHNINLPIYWGNRNWTPFIKDTLVQMHADGVRHALLLFTAGYGSYSSCRQYREDIAGALEEAGITDMTFDKLRAFFNHPGFIKANADNLRAALEQYPAERRDSVHVAFSAHSIPTAMAEAGPYVRQLMEASRLTAEEVGVTDWELVYQSRSGPPHQPWLEPDICDHIEAKVAEGQTDIINLPIGFLSDHMEVIYDLDTEAKQVAEEQGAHFVRAATVGTHPEFIGMLRHAILERVTGTDQRLAMGKMAAGWDVCPPGCCRLPQMPKRPAINDVETA